MDFRRFLPEIRCLSPVCPTRYGISSVVFPKLLHTRERRFFILSLDILGTRGNMTLQDIKEAVVHLSESERRQLTEWFDELKEDEWDRQMEKDFSAGGRGMAWGEKVEADIAAGKFTSLEEGLRLRREQRAKQ